MALDPALRERIETLIGSKRVVLFMKGTRHAPQCGFSATTVGILDSLVPDYATVNVLEDQGIREGIKDFSEWPTIPQLYVNKEFMGGCDVVKQMFNTGALHEALGVPAPDRTPPEIALGEEAAALIRNALEGQPGMSVHLGIDGNWQHTFTLGPAEGHEVKASANGIEILMDVATAQRARGLEVKLVETLQGTAFDIRNPNAPPPVEPMTPEELKRRLDAGESTYIFDVRPPDERARAVIEGARPLDEEAMRLIESLPADAAKVFYCHYGQRSQAAAEHFRVQGLSNLYNLTGGIDAWSTQVDDTVPRY